MSLLIVQANSSSVIIAKYITLIYEKKIEEKMQFELRVSILLALMSALVVTAASNISILLSLPLHQISEPRMSWERGFEILPGALLAVNDINNDSTILPGHNLQLIIKNETEIVQQFVNLTFHQTHSNIVGIGGILHPKTISILLLLVKHKGMLLSAITHKDMLEISDYSDTFLSLPSPTSIVDVLLNFMRIMNWHRIGLITESTDAYFFSVSEMLLQKLQTNNDITVSPYAELSHIKPAIYEIIKLNTRVIIVSINARRAIQLLCAVYEKGLVWPEYAWIFHSFQIEDLLDQKSICDIKNVVNGIFLIDNEPESNPSRGKLISKEITFSNHYQQYLSSLSETALEYNITLRPNRYAGLVYNLVWNMAISLNRSCHQSANCLQQTEGLATAAQLLEPHRGHNELIFKIFHVKKLQPVLVSAMHYNSSFVTVTSFNASILESAPKGELPLVTVHPPFGYTVLISLQIALTTVFVTIILVLYVYFRNEPEVKATSFTLSLLMFAGCYLNMIYLSLLSYYNHILHSIDISRDNVLCVTIQWVSASGISLPLMLATLLVKMLRIYHIFYNDKLRRLGCYCSDLSLALYILLILLPGILLNVIWDIVDRYQIHFEYRVQDGYTYLEKLCSSKYQAPLYGVVTIYWLALILALAVVAIITRKVRLQRFKDTKKVNILLFILSAIIIISLSYWLLLETLNTKVYIATLPLHVGHMLVVIVYLSLLFVPKIVPPLCRHIKDTYYKIN